ncbi:hypothetical protein ACWDRR_00715 [Kitasatospora sp. NPDC003701]
MAQTYTDSDAFWAWHDSRNGERVRVGKGRTEHYAQTRRFGNDETLCSREWTSAGVIDPGNWGTHGDECKPCLREALRLGRDILTAASLESEKENAVADKLNEGTVIEAGGAIGHVGRSAIGHIVADREADAPAAVCHGKPLVRIVASAEDEGYSEHHNICTNCAKKWTPPAAPASSEVEKPAEASPEGETSADAEGGEGEAPPAPAPLVDPFALPDDGTSDDEKAAKAESVKAQVLALVAELEHAADPDAVEIEGGALLLELPGNSGADLSTMLRAAAKARREAIKAERKELAARAQAAIETQTYKDNPELVALVAQGTKLAKRLLKHEAEGARLEEEMAYSILVGRLDCKFRGAIDGNGDSPGAKAMAADMYAAAGLDDKADAVENPTVEQRIIGETSRKIKKAVSNAFPDAKARLVRTAVLNPALAAKVGIHPLELAEDMAPEDRDAAVMKAANELAAHLGITNETRAEQGRRTRREEKLSKADAKTLTGARSSAKAADNALTLAADIRKSPDARDAATVDVVKEAAKAVAPLAELAPRLHTEKSRAAIRAQIQALREELERLEAALPADEPDGQGDDAKADGQGAAAEGAAE